MVDPEKVNHDVEVLRESGLFDAEFYRPRVPCLPKEADPLVHFCEFGSLEGLSPNPYFSAAYYCRTNPDIEQAGVNALVHYLEFGDREGRAPSPRFDPIWYRERYGLEPETSASRISCRAGTLARSARYRSLMPPGISTGTRMSPRAAPTRSNISAPSVSLGAAIRHPIST